MMSIRNNAAHVQVRFGTFVLALIATVALAGCSQPVSVVDQRMITMELCLSTASTGHGATATCASSPVTFTASGRD